MIDKQARESLLFKFAEKLPLDLAQAIQDRRYIFAHAKAHLHGRKVKTSNFLVQHYAHPRSKQGEVADWDTFETMEHNVNRHISNLANRYHRQVSLTSKLSALKKKKKTKK